MSDPLIDNLVAELKPQKPLQNIKFWLHCTVCLVAFSAVVVGMMGLRPDYLAAVKSGALFWKPGVFFLIWLGSLLLSLDLSRPQGAVRITNFVTFACAVLVLLWQYTFQANAFSVADVANALMDGSASICLGFVIGGGVMALGLAWQFWYSKTASPRPMLLGALAGLNAGALTSTAYALYCNHDTALYVSLIYVTAILVLVVIGAAMGYKFLRW